MTTGTDPITRYQDEIVALIDEIEARLSGAHQRSGREYRLQAEVFRERAARARSLAERLSATDAARWTQMDGEAWRLRQALELSREFFGRDH